MINAEALAEEAINARVQGVTLLGGEPTEQSSALAAFASLVKEAGLSVMTFTGRTLDELRALSRNQPGVTELLGATDLLIDGPYRADQPDLTRPWVGSVNQQVHFLTERYAHLKAALATLPDKIEVRVTTAGEVSINGWATVDQLDDLLSGSLPALRRGHIR